MQLWNSGRYSWKTLCLALHHSAWSQPTQLGVSQHSNAWHGFLCCAICLSSSGTVVQPMTSHVTTVKVSQQEVYTPATFLFFSSVVVADCSSVWLVVPALYKCDSMLACLTCCVSPPGLISCCDLSQAHLVAGAFLCQQQCSPWLSAVQILSGFSY